MLHLRQCLAVVAVGCFLSACGTSSARQAGPTLPPGTGPRSSPSTTAAPPTTTTIPLLERVKEVSDVLARLYPTTSVPVPVVHVVPPRQQPPVVSVGPSTEPSGGVPQPVSGRRCVDYGRPDIGQLIEGVFGSAGPWAESVAARESNCLPSARNSEGASGLFQLMLPLHDGLLSAVCPGIPPSMSWSNATCNTLAAHRLFLADGIGPWKL